MNPDNSDDGTVSSLDIVWPLESACVAPDHDDISLTYSSTIDDSDQHIEISTPGYDSDDYVGTGTLGSLRAALQIYAASPQPQAISHDSTPPPELFAYSTNAQNEVQKLGSRLNVVMRRPAGLSPRRQSSIPQLIEPCYDDLSMQAKEIEDGGSAGPIILEDRLDVYGSPGGFWQQLPVARRSTPLLPSTVAPLSTSLTPPSPPQPPQTFAARVSAAIAATNAAALAQKISGVSIVPQMTEHARRTQLDKRLVKQLDLDAVTRARPPPLTFDEGISIFVDISNIYFGFTEHLQWVRNETQSDRRRLHFASLARIMERDRVIRARALVGSLPMLPGSERAELAKYDCSWLERVRKIKLTDQRKRAATDYESGYGTADWFHTQPARPQMAEQGVDEILQLKMLETICDQPPGIMVVATGDAAEAEYSGGFLEQIERALAKGWWVELITWSYNMSGAYNDHAFRRQWGVRFRVVYLDEYADLLKE